MFRPEDPFGPRGDAFAEGWHAQVLALASAMERAGSFSARDWAAELGAGLQAAEARGAQDDEATYYGAALAALETLTARQGCVSMEDQVERKARWEAAYLRTPHGKPVLL